jgi:molecular chaperone DnaK
MGRKIGIDLGTTFSLASFINAAGHPELIPNAEGSVLTPSLVWIKGQEIQVGQNAANMPEPEFLAAQMKRNMGSESYTFHGHDATEISSLILKKMVGDAEALFGERVEAAAITVPAYFTSGPRLATKKAGEMAGIEVLALPNEPTAAALHYGTSHMRDRDLIQVFDLGGGTMDATILEVSMSAGEAEFRVLASDGSRDLGGEDWTTRLMEMMEERVSAEFGCAPGSDYTLARALTEACERAKRALTVQDHTRLAITYRGKTVSLPVARDEFEEQTWGLLEQALAKAESALGRCGLAWGGLSRVLLVGGATRMPMVARTLHERSCMEPECWGNPDQLVALGAALYTSRRTVSGAVELVVGRARGAVAVGSGAGGDVAIKLRESTTHGLGTLVVEKAGRRVRTVSSVILPPRTEIPAERTRGGYSTQPHQTEIDVPVIQADTDGLDPQSCTVHKTYRFLGIPDRPSPSEITVTFRYDVDNLIEVTALDTATGRALEKMIVDFAFPTNGTVASVALLLDTSYSMEGKPLDELKEQVMGVCGELAGSDCGVAVVEFGARTMIACPLTGDMDRVRESVSRLRAGGSTPMAEGLTLACDALRDAGRNSVAILVSDGYPDSQTRASAEADHLKQMGVALYTISIGTAGAAFLRSIGDEYTEIDSVGDLGTAIGNLLWR